MTPPDPCRLCGLPRSPAEAVAYLSLCEDCAAAAAPPSGRRRPADVLRAQGQVAERPLHHGDRVAARF